jgi:hypothetical protein
MKHFGLTGINANVQFGKGSGRVKYDTDHFEVRNTADNSLIAVQAASPTNSNDLATKQYVDNVVQGLHVKDSVRVATDSVTANDMANLAYNSGTDVWTLTGTTLDGVTVGNNSRVLIKDATNKKGNGLFVNLGGTLTRISDPTFGGGDFVFVQQGTTWADSGWVVSLPNGVATIGVNDIEFAQFSSISGVYATDGLGKTGNQVYVKTDDATTHITGDTISVKSTATQYQVLTSTGTATDNATWGTVNLASASAVTGILPKTNGGFGQDPDTFTAQSLIYRDGTGLTSLAKGTADYVLKVNSGGTAIGYEQVNLTTSVTGTLPIASGGTNATTASNARTSLGLVIGTDIQAFDQQLVDVAGLTSTDSNFIVGDGTNFITEADNTARTSLGVGTGDSPTFTGLTVSGTTASFNGLTYTMPSVAGSTGQILRSNGSGTITWDNESGAVGENIFYAEDFAYTSATIPVLRKRELLFHAETTNATQTELFQSGVAGTGSIVVASRTTIMYEARIIAREKTGSESVGYILKGMVERDTPNNLFSFINPTVEEILAESVNNWDAVASLNSTQNTLEFKVTGELNKNILWLAHITLSEADYS